GTHGIQALDLLGRKVVMHEGAAFKLLSARIGATVKQAAGAAHEDTRRWAGLLERRLARLADVTRIVWAAGDPAKVLANATPYLEAFGHVVLAWIWLEQSLTASRNYSQDESDFYHGKRAACRYFFLYELPKVDAWLDLVAAVDTTTLEMNPAWF
ncbi:MAG: acyl-CoA dehydrogenase C-terminal domain-containing protein, partial [Burkholderiaceae bacterium]